MKLEKKLKIALKSKDKLIIDEVYEEIYNEYYKLIYFVILQIIKNKEETEELVNDTFLKAFNNITKFKEDTSLKSWIVQIAKNTAINQYNKNKKTNTTLDFDYIMNLESETPTDFDELIKEFRQYLTIQESNIILFRVYYDMKLKDIAEYYETSINDIYSIYQKAIKTLKKHYKKGDF